MKITFDTSRFLRALTQTYKPEAQAAAARAVGVFGEAVMGKAQRLAPVDTGTLKGSGVTDDPVIEDGRIRSEVGFNTDYAAAVHERLDLHHPQGQAKFLEAPMREMAPKLAGFVQDELRKAGL